MAIKPELRAWPTSLCSSIKSAEVHPAQGIVTGDQKRFHSKQFVRRKTHKIKTFHIRFTYDHPQEWKMCFGPDVLLFLWNFCCVTLFVVCISLWKWRKYLFPWYCAHRICSMQSKSFLLFWMHGINSCKNNSRIINRKNKTRKRMQNPPMWEMMM